MLKGKGMGKLFLFFNLFFNNKGTYKTVFYYIVQITVVKFQTLLLLVIWCVKHYNVTRPINLIYQSWLWFHRYGLCQLVFCWRVVVFFVLFFWDE